MSVICFRDVKRYKMFVNCLKFYITDKMFLKIWVFEMEVKKHLLENDKEFSYHEEIAKTLDT